MGEKEGADGIKWQINKAKRRPQSGHAINTGLGVGWREDMLMASSSLTRTPHILEGETPFQLLLVH